MSLPSPTLALLTSLLIVGCATNEPQSPPQIQTWHRDDVSSTRRKRRMCNDHLFSARFSASRMA